VPGLYEPRRGQCPRSMRPDRERDGDGASSTRESSGPASAPTRRVSLASTGGARVGFAAASARCLVDRTRRHHGEPLRTMADVGGVLTRPLSLTSPCPSNRARLGRRRMQGRASLHLVLRAGPIFWQRGAGSVTNGQARPGARGRASRRRCGDACQQLWAVRPSMRRSARTRARGPPARARGLGDKIIDRGRATRRCSTRQGDAWNGGHGNTHERTARADLAAIGNGLLGAATIYGGTERDPEGHRVAAAAQACPGAHHDGADPKRALLAGDAGQLAREH